LSSLRLVVDSSIWIEVFNNGPLAKICLKKLEQAEAVFVPSLVIYEVYKKIAASRSEDDALSAIAAMSQHQLVDLSRDIALSAADISLQNSLAMADSVMLAHAQTLSARFLTLDNDFVGIKGCEVLRSSS
jgi:predicted nucleic acid-binding protein